MAEPTYRALVNFHWNGSDDVPARWFYIEDEVPESIAASVAPICTDRPTPADSSEDGQGDSDPAPALDPATAGDTAPPSDDPTVIPPKSGKGSSRAAWAAYADTLGVSIVESDERDEIIAHIEAAGHPTA